MTSKAISHAFVAGFVKAATISSLLGQPNPLQLPGQFKFDPSKMSGIPTTFNQNLPGVVTNKPSYLKNVVTGLVNYLKPTPPHQFHYDPNATQGLLPIPQQNRFMKALWGKETGYSKHWDVQGDLKNKTGPALGPLQEHPDFAEDAFDQAPRLIANGNNAGDRTNLLFASQIEQAYQNKYNRQALLSLMRNPNNQKAFQELIALHHGGTSRWQAPASKPYVKSFQSWYNVNNNKPMGQY